MPRNEFLIKTASLSVGALPADPLCARNGRAFPSPVAINATASNYWTAGDSAVPSAVRSLPPLTTYLTLSFNEDPLGLTGCQGPASPPALRPLTLATQGTSFAGSTPYTLRGSLAALKLADGAEATLDVTLVVKTVFDVPAIAGNSS